MRKVRVWAPKSNSVNIDLGSGRVPMTAQPRGWWSGTLPDGAVDYTFVLDDGVPLPDPRSPHQPYGVHGGSRTVDHAAFPWTDSGWQPAPLDTAIVYELHIGTFTEEGTFEAAIEHIPHLLDLGITHVELMPVAEFPGDWGWGYDGVDLFAPQHAYGGPEGLKRLVNALHAAGLAAILDVVYNHLGPAGNYLGRFGPYFTDRVRTPWGDGVNFSEGGSDEVRGFFIENALMWLGDYHFDGLRLDAVHAITDSSAVHFLEELTSAVAGLENRLGRPLCMIAESDLNDPRLIRPRTRGGYGLSALWSDDFHHALHTVLTGERTGYYSDFGYVSHLAKAIENGYVYTGEYSAFRDRRHGRPLEYGEKSRLLGYIQNHDQIGNRANGERIGQLTGFAHARIGAAMTLLGPFIPLIFQGEEWGAGTPFQYFTNHSDPDLGRAVSNGRRQEFASFGWSPEQVPDPQDPETFRRSKLNWRELNEEPHREMLSWYSRLIRFRREHPELASAAAKVRFDEAQQWLAMERPGIEVICNFGRSPVRVPYGRHRGTVRFSTADGAGADGAVPPAAVLVFENPGSSEGSPRAGELESVPVKK
ncbi:MAG: malto-oligosyltrehalose trehalohydrolase [Acidobacteriia bacterium]|nr:malto-oligosyltrehalose trehalohydrolase [Terriglobia bacterium]